VSPTDEDITLANVAPPKVMEEEEAEAEDALAAGVKRMPGRHLSVMGLPMRVVMPKRSLAKTEPPDLTVSCQGARGIK
jgi:hypothetical protein